MTLEQLSRALAAHALIVGHPDRLHDFFAPENGEAVATLILRFALGEPLSRPEPPEATTEP